VIVQCAVDMYSSMQSLLLLFFLTLSKSLVEAWYLGVRGREPEFFHLLTSSTRVRISTVGYPPVRPAVRMAASMNST
jgi:hypothetical protein